jgi:hypothetical protein
MLPGTVGSWFSKQFGNLGLQGALAGEEVNAFTLTPRGRGHRSESGILGRRSWRISKGTTIHYQQMRHAAVI